MNDGCTEKAYQKPEDHKKGSKTFQIAYQRIEKPAPPASGKWALIYISWQVALSEDKTLGQNKSINNHKG